MAQISAAASTALSTSYTVMPCTATTAGEAVAAPVPDVCWLEDCHLQLDTIATATTVTWFIAADAAGDVPLTHEVTTAIVTGATTATAGAVVEILSKWYVRYDVGVSETIYVVAKLDAGTANAIPRITWNLSS